MTELVVVSTLEFMSPVNRDNGYTNEPLSANAKSEMTMYKTDYGYNIEWVIDELEEVNHIGLYCHKRTFDGARTHNHNKGNCYISDYDGVYELPAEVKPWLVSLRISFDEDLFLDD